MQRVPVEQKVAVFIENVDVQVGPPSWRLEYVVRNSSEAIIWLIVDESLKFQLENNHIELSYARGQMQSGVQAFGYFNPKVTKILPGESLRQSVNLSWPQSLSTLWNAERKAAPSPGEYEVSIRVGIALKEAPEPPKLGETIEASVLRWQEEVVSPAMRIRIPRYL
ncbi:MAG: hypothetical protein ACRCYY_19800 [Trueperaceae bacterium]